MIRARIRGFVDKRSILRRYFGGRNERIETDLVQSDNRKKSGSALMM